MSELDVAFATLDADPGERFASLRRRLGVSSFGMNLIVLEPRQRGRIHAHERQEEVYLVLEGELTLVLEGGAERVLSRGELARVGPAVRRQLVNAGGERARAPGARGRRRARRPRRAGVGVVEAGGRGARAPGGAAARGPAGVRAGGDPHTDPRFESAALITIDTQRDTLDGGPLEVAGTSAALRAMRHARARPSAAARQPIVHVVRLYEPDGEQRRPLPPRGGGGGAAILAHRRPRHGARRRAAARRSAGARRAAAARGRRAAARRRGGRDLQAALGRVLRDAARGPPARAGT